MNLNRAWFLMILLLFVYSCKEDTSKGWSESNKKKYMKGCLSNERMNSEQKKKFCSCALSKVEIQYPTFKKLGDAFGKAPKIESDILLSLLKGCVNDSRK